MSDFKLISRLFATGDYDKFNKIYNNYDKNIIKQLKPFYEIHLSTKMDILDEYKISRNIFLGSSILLSSLSLLPLKSIHKPTAAIIVGSLVSVTAFNQFQYIKMKYIVEGQKSIINSMNTDEDQ